MEITISKRNREHMLRDGLRFRNARVLKDGDVSRRCIVRICPVRLRIHEPDVIVLSNEVNEHNLEPRNDSGEAQQTTSDASSNGKRKRRRGQKKHRSSTEETAVSIKSN